MVAEHQRLAWLYIPQEAEMGISVSADNPCGMGHRMCLHIFTGAKSQRAATVSGQYNLINVHIRHAQTRNRPVVGPGPGFYCCTAVQTFGPGIGQ